MFDKIALKINNGNYVFDQKCVVVDFLFINSINLIRLYHSI